MKALVISAFARAGDGGTAAEALLQERLVASGYEVATVDARAAGVSPCRGCGACGLRSAGRCVVDDGMESIYRELVASQLLVFAEPIRLGGHFLPRYDPRLAVFGVAAPSGRGAAAAEEARAYRHLIARHALNLDAPAHAVALVAGQDDGDDWAAIDLALSAVQAGRSCGAAQPVAPAACPGSPADERRAPPRRVVIVQGSPRRRSNTRALVARLVADLEARGTRVDVVHVPAGSVGAG